MAPKSWKSQLWEFQDSHLGVLGQNAIWMWDSWKSTKYTIRGKVVASPKFELWWILWIQVCLWLVLAPKVQLCTNHLVFGFVQVCLNSWCFSLFLVPFWNSSTPLYPPKCCELGSMPRLLTFLLFSFQTHIWIYQGAWEHVM